MAKSGEKKNKEGIATFVDVTPTSGTIATTSILMPIIIKYSGIEIELNADSDLCLFEKVLKVVKKVNV